MTILGAVFVPHEAMILDPLRSGAPEGIEEISRSCDVAADVISKWEPECVVVITPHGISADRSPRPGIYLTKTGSGSAATTVTQSNSAAEGGHKDEDKDKDTTPAQMKDAVTASTTTLDTSKEGSNLGGEPAREGQESFVAWGEYSVKVDFDVEIASGFLNFLGDQGVACVKVTGQDAPLTPREVVPLWFLRNLPNTAKSPKFVLLSVPNTGSGGSSIARSKTSKGNLVGLTEYGRNLQRYFSRIASKVALVFVGDLAHTHASLVSQPEYMAPEGKRLAPCDAAAVFDAMVEKWATTLNSDILVSDAAALVDKVISCGFDSLVALNGLLEKDGVHKYSKHVLSRHRPSYVGMMTAVFQADKRVKNPEYLFEFS